MAQGEPRVDSLSLEEKREIVREALREITAKRRVDPKMRRRMRRLRQKAKAKRNQKKRKRKPIRKEKGRLILDVSPFAFNKSPEANRPNKVRNPITRNKVKIRSLSGHPDLRAYKIYRKHYDKWKRTWKRKFEKIKARAKRKRERVQRKDNKRKRRSKRAADLLLTKVLIRVAYEDASLRPVILDILWEDGQDG
jgi:transposase